jgi:aminoglycoside phosphotransferase (APT) family kinase protein
MSGFGKPSGFYSRQLKTFNAIQHAQSKTKDKETGKEVGKIPHFDDTVNFFSKIQPVDRSSFVHGDYKIDNMVFHKSEARVIGILE